MKKEEVREFLKARGVDGFVTTAMVAKALGFKPQVVSKAVRDGQLKRVDRNCFSEDDILNWIWVNPRWIARAKSMEAAR